VITVQHGVTAPSLTDALKKYTPLPLVIISITCEYIATARGRITIVSMPVMIATEMKRSENDEAYQVEPAARELTYQVFDKCDALNHIPHVR
jgi:hypothetical protein